MDAVPLVSSLADPRNLVSLVFYLTLASISARVVAFLFPTIWQIVSLKTLTSRQPDNCCGLTQFQLLSQSSSKTPSSSSSDEEEEEGRGEEGGRKIDTIQVIAVSLSLLILPFLPATNLFFYVGFVLAERVLYLPSLGYCLLLSYSLVALAKRVRGHTKAAAGLLAVIVKAATLTLLVTLGAQTVVRCRAWASEQALFTAGLTVNPAKSWANLGNILDAAGNADGSAELAFKQALLHRPNMADTHYNLGILLQNQRRLDEAAAAYRAAIRFRPRLGLAYLNLGLTVSALGRRSEAIRILEACSKVEDNGLKDPAENVNARISAMLHLGKLLLESGDPHAAISILQRAAAVSRAEGEARGAPAGPHLEKVLNLLGDSFQHSGKSNFIIL